MQIWKNKDAILASIKSFVEMHETKVFVHHYHVRANASYQAARHSEATTSHSTIGSVAASSKTPGSADGTTAKKPASGIIKKPPPGYGKHSRQLCLYILKPLMMFAP
jgi:hypothetical protein